MLDDIVPVEMLYPDGKTYTEDDTYVLKWKFVTEDGSVREYGRRKTDNKIVMTNVQEILRKKRENSQTPVV